jgi:hypothetical protein
MNPLLYSAEVRWFIPGQLQDDILRWFTRDQSLELETGRSDEYLSFPRCETVGVKLRQKRFEIKAIIGVPTPLVGVAGVSGRTDRWVKWSFASDALESVLGDLHRSGRWFVVSKTRYLRKFSFDSGAPIEVTQANKPLPACGCNVELTRLEVDSNTRDWISIGFEAFGPSENTPRILTAAVEQFFDSHGVPSVELNDNNSRSYPAWLASLSTPQEQ